MSYKMAISNLFNTKDVVFSNDELLKIIAYALKNNLITVEFKQINTLMVIPKNLVGGTPIKDDDKIKIPFYEDGLLQAEIFLMPKEEIEEVAPVVVKPLNKDILSWEKQLKNRQ